MCICANCGCAPMDYCMDPYCDRLIVCEDCRAQQTAIDEGEFDDAQFDDEPDFSIDPDDPTQPGWEP